MNIRKNCSAGFGGIALGGLLGTTVLCAAGAPALADAGDNDTLDLSDLQRVADGSLEDLRGGFSVGNFDISFGMTISTAVNGQQVLQTSFNVANPGQIDNLSSSQGGGAAAGGTLANGTNWSVNTGTDAKAGFQAGSTAPLGASNQTTAAAGDGTPSQRPSEVAASGEAPGWTYTQVEGGWQATSENLATTVMHQIDKAITTSVTNSADNQVIQTTTSMDMVINNFDQVQAQASVNRMLTNTMVDIANQSIMGN